MTEPPGNPGPFEIVTIGASAGGLKALIEVLSALPPGFPVPVAVVQHLDRSHRSYLAQILRGKTALEVAEAREGDVLRVGAVFIAPPDRHLLVTEGGRLTLTDTKLVHFVRPSVDLLFESVAAHFGEAAIAVVLTGAGSDGALGVTAIKKMGGLVIAQDWATSEFYGMPGDAIRTGNVDRILPLGEIGPALVSLVMAREGG
jgi:two-component system chemotaxis response regulator CheB